MATRKTTKTATTAAEGMEMILASEPLKTIDEAAKYVGVSGFELQEKLAETLNLPAALGWETLPAEHDHLLNEFKATVNGTQALQEPLQQTETPKEVDSSLPAFEAPKAQKGRGGKLANRGKKASTELTNQKSSEIANTQEETSQIEDGIAETLIDFAALEGLQDSSNAATAYGAAFKTNLSNKKGEIALSIATEMLHRTSDKRSFSTDEILKRLGVPLSAQTRQELSEDLAEMSSELHSATEEIATTSWGNGQSPKDALTRLRELRKLNS